jgi:hypothetical protein
MSLVLNGGVGGSDSTQYAYRDSRIVSALPCTLAVWFKNGTGVSAEGQVAGWMDADATIGTYRMGGSLARSTGPVFTRQITSRTISAVISSVTTRTTVSQNVTDIGTGATTAFVLDDASRYSVGEYVRITGTFTGISGITSGREYRIGSIAGSTINLEVATTGAWNEGLTATVRWSAWQPEKWNLMVLTFTETEPRMTHMGGFVGNSGLTVLSSFGGTSGQFPADIFSVLDRVTLGALFQSAGATGHFRGELAHFAVWNGVTPTESQAAELLTVAPNLVSWGAPTAYVPLTNNENDVIGVNHLTLVGSPSINSDGPAITLTGGGGGSAGYLPSVMRARNPSIFGVR